MLMKRDIRREKVEKGVSHSTGRAKGKLEMSLNISGVQIRPIIWENFLILRCPRAALGPLHALHRPTNFQNFLKKGKSHFYCISSLQAIKCGP